MAIAPARAGIGIRRHFTVAGEDPYDTVTWERRDARISHWQTGAVAFEQPGVEVPSTWSINATNILAQKYFRGTLGTPEREWSLKQVADRVVEAITGWGRKDGYFVDEEEADAFAAELRYLIIHQRAAFNSPVWFNIGVPGVPQQGSACFILSVEDSMDSILEWYKEEGTIFKGGSGAGVNLSRIRSSKEHLRGGGTASGPVSFMRGADASAGTIKSGGKTRRAAKMVILDVDHPDIGDFVWCKAIEERKARALRDAGFDMDLDGKDSHSIQYQNANNSVRVTDAFMQAVVDDDEWYLRAVTTGEVIETVRARELYHEMALAAWECADPGMQFDTTINRWHTSPVSGRINGSNPCSEYMHLDNSACNLASLNLLTFLGVDGSFDVEGFTTSVETVFTAQEILVGNADYPTEPIAANSRRFRQLGIGYANLGALLMAQGLAYDSDGGRAWAAAITALLTGHAYATSARTASRMGPYAGFTENKDATLAVLRMHRDAAAGIDEELVPPELLSAAQQSWDSAVEISEQFGVRNAQASVLAPTGTIGLLMDCDTTGIEPDLGLVKMKKLVGGGTMSIINQTVPRALARLGYDQIQIADVAKYIDEHKSIVGAPHLKAEHLPVFACSMGDNTIHYRGHIKMMGAVQPFISGAISKCVVGETLVTTADGLVRIASLHEGEAPGTFRNEVVEVASLGGPTKTDAFFYGGLQPVREAVLQSGHRVVATLNHRVLGVGAGGLDWIRLDELSVGDWVATQYGADLWSVLPVRLDGFCRSTFASSPRDLELPAEVTEDLAVVLGAYGAYGRTVRSTSTVIFQLEGAFGVERLTAAFGRAFGRSLTIRQGPSGTTSLEVRSTTLIELLERLGCGDLTSTKRIPDAVLRSPRPVVVAYLDGLSLAGESDDGQNVAPWRGGSVQPSSWSIRLGNGLLDDVQVVLTNLGVVHRRAGASTEVLGELHVGGELSDVLPSWLPPAGDDGLHFSEVRSVDDAGLREVFDLSVPSTHAFVANGVVNHNTVNMPEEATVEEIEQLHIEAWQLGLKAVAIYRDNCKVAQPLATAKKATAEVVADLSALAEEVHDTELARKVADLESALARQTTVVVKQPIRERMPRRRRSNTFSFRVADCEGYVTVGEYVDGRPGEVFMKVAKQGSTLAGIMDAFAISVSLGFQHGVPLATYVKKYTNMRFEPAGMTDDPDLRIAQSLVDYIFRRLAVDYLSLEERTELGVLTSAERTQQTLPGVDEAVTPNSSIVELDRMTAAATDLLADDDLPRTASSVAAPLFAPTAAFESDSPYCMECGVQMQRSGSCHACPSCGTTSGCS